MIFNFHNAENDIIFESNNKRGIVLIGNVQKFSVVSDNLIALVGNFEKRRLSVKINSIVNNLPVNFFSDETAGQDSISNNPILY